MSITRISVASMIALAAVVASPLTAQTRYSVVVTNVSANQIISPPLVVVHSPRTSLFQPGRPASDALAALAEDADASGLLTAIAADPFVGDWAIAGSPLPPGASATLELVVDGPFPLLSAVGMLVTTNDAFFGLNGFPIRGGLWRKSTTAPAWDAGSEANTESCDDIPGPPCNHPFVRVQDGAEGTVRIHPGILGVGLDLSAEGYSWLNPVVNVTVFRRQG